MNVEIIVSHEDTVEGFKSTAACINCGARASSDKTIREKRPDGKVAIRPADLPPDFKFDSRQRLLKQENSSCPFCGVAITKANDSKEHVLGRWLREVREIRENFIKSQDAGKWRWTLDHPIMAADGSIVIMPQPRKLASKVEHPLYLTVPICKECNNQWMSQLETAVAPILTPLINGVTSTVSLEHIPLVARWITKTAIAMEQDDLATAVMGRTQARDVKLGRVARWSAIWVAAWGDPNEVLLRHDVAMAFDRVNNQHVAQFGRTWIGLGSGLAIYCASGQSPVSDFSLLWPGEPWTQLWPCTADVEIPVAPVTRSDIEKISANS